MKQSKRRSQQRQRGDGQEPLRGGTRDVRDDAGCTDELIDDLILAAAHVQFDGSDDAHLRYWIDALAQGLGLECGR